MTTLSRQRIERSIESKGFQHWRLRGQHEPAKSALLARAIERSLIPLPSVDSGIFAPPGRASFIDRECHWTLEFGTQVFGLPCHATPLWAAPKSSSKTRTYRTVRRVRAVIRVGTPQETTMPTGSVKWFNPTKGYGFIQPQSGGKDVFVHISAVERAGLSTLNEGQIVQYEIVSNRGKESAENLKVGG
jgi:CspA family cold shock protein